MNARELLSFAMAAAAFLVLMMELSAPAMAHQNTDLIGASQDIYDPTDMGDNLSEMVQLLAAVLETSYENRPAKSSPDKTPFPAIANSATTHAQRELTSLLDKILSSPASSRQEINNDPPSLDHESYQEDIPVVATKRGRDEYGAMPPLNELCRMMGVKCY
ncbi:hypothetical protein BsWGS_28719 [Bradybaena similaris]